MIKKENDKNEFDDDFKIDEGQFEITPEIESSENKEKVLEETESVPIDEKEETIHFPWFIAIIIGVLMLAIIGLIIAIKVIEG